jgi:hypothetical protein
MGKPVRKEKLVGGRGNIIIGKQVEKERLVGGRGNLRIGKPVGDGKAGRREGN